VGSYNIHFTNGRTRSMEIVYGIDLQSLRTQQGDSLWVGNSKLAWLGATQDIHSDDPQSLRLFKSSWDNPWPDAEIASVDFVSSESGAKPFLVGITAE
jgi:hypothetical protein